MTTSLPHASPRGDGADHTVAEIAQQPAVWREIGAALTAARAELDAFLGPLLAEQELRIVLTGAGTSAFAGEVVRAALARTTGRRVDAVSTTDIVADPRAAFPDDVPTLLVSFARSGDSPESVAATRLAEQVLHRVHHLVLTCNSEGQLARTHRENAASQVLLMPAAANDRGFAMTSSFTGMLVACLLAFGALDTGGVEAAAAAAEHLTAGGLDRDIDTLLARRPERMVYLGSSSALKGLAHESALKLLELTGGALVASAESALGFRHGPKSVLTARTAVLVYVSNDPYTRRYDLDILAELRADLAPGSVVAVTASLDGLPEDSSWLLPGLAGADDATLALPAVLTAQLIALRSSLAHGIRPDNPFPSGEVNRVVRGVTVHPLPGGRDGLASPRPGKAERRNNDVSGCGRRRHQDGLLPDRQHGHRPGPGAG
ncbi:putative tagatose-6-phosphate ketose/aldose isomerase [Streptomyces sp. NBRC 13847]|uniref:SIS domain-containing protein n=1 Tax=Streptomyces TaxID=1883 RepID=UPI0024A19485|nr:SIS domain-containing protein [Streptomyces sp. NBRC 13847]GLW17184.1 putative tagatose-6-phosphate ketose/aldose isomerase [Streptomyces sp. NBRC 13847]